MGISDPSPIQQQGIPMALSGSDVVGISKTGSGKTLAYVLPAIVHIQAQPIVEKGEGPIGLILCPTRELCKQIDDEITKYLQSMRSNSKKMILKHLAVYGGKDRNSQIKYLQYNSPDILVATPGRLIDLFEQGETNFLRTTYVVLDEADRMLDMGFRPDLERILRCIRPDRQILMWSATWPKDIQNIANSYMNNPLRCQIGSNELHANSNIQQNFRLIKDGIGMGSNKEKIEYFVRDIQEICVEHGKKVLVFANTKRDADNLEYALKKFSNINAKSIHSDKTQSQREEILFNFKMGNSLCLIATDVVARGIDIRDISVVLIYDFPATIETYVHRIGRTARADDKGVSLTYMNLDDIGKHRKQLLSVLNKSKQKIPKFLTT